MYMYTQITRSSVNELSIWIQVFIRYTFSIDDTIHMYINAKDRETRRKIAKVVRSPSSRCQSSSREARACAWFACCSKSSILTLCSNSCFASVQPLSFCSLFVNTNKVSCITSLPTVTNCVTKVWNMNLNCTDQSRKQQQ